MGVLKRKNTKRRKRKKIKNGGTMRMRTSKQKFERQWKNSKEKKQKWKKLPMIGRDPITQYQRILTKSFPKQKLKHTREEEYEKMTPWLGSCKEITSKMTTIIKLLLVIRHDDRENVSKLSTILPRASYWKLIGMLIASLRLIVYLNVI